MSEVPSPLYRRTMSLYQLLNNETELQNTIDHRISKGFQIGVHPLHRPTYFLLHLIAELQLEIAELRAELERE